jgi:hypothetical protein
MQLVLSLALNLFFLFFLYTTPYSYINKTIFSLNQFPDDDLVEVVPAKYSKEKQSFVDYDLNIGWAMHLHSSYHTMCKDILYKFKAKYTSLPFVLKQSIS